jgi:cell division protein FtsQ
LRNQDRFTVVVANLLYGLAGVLLLYALIFLVIRLPVFPIRHVEVEGRLVHLNREQVIATVRSLKGNFFSLDLAEAKAAFENTAWTRRADVRRRWPDRLTVTIEEHVPLARWGTIGLVNTRGELFQARADAPLPVFYGPAGMAGEMARQFTRFSITLSRIGLAPTDVRMTSRHAWKLKLTNGLAMELGRRDVEERLSRFAAVYDRTLAPAAGRVKYVDLRYPNGFAVRLPDGMAPAREKDGKQA